MKALLPTFTISLAAFVGFAVSLNAQSIWNGTNNLSASTNWSSAANWLPPPVAQIWNRPCEPHPAILPCRR